MRIRLITLVAIIVLGVALTAGVTMLLTNKDFGLMKTTKDDNGIVINAQENTTVIENKIMEEIKEISKTNTEIVKINKQLEQFCWTVDDIIDLKSGEYDKEKEEFLFNTYNKNLINDEAVRYYIVRDQLKKYEAESTISGEYITGTTSYKWDEYCKVYKQLFGEEASIQKTTSIEGTTIKPEIKDGILYSDIVTGRSGDSTLKFNSLKYNENTKVYTLNITYLKSTKDNSYEDISKASDPSTLSWNESLNNKEIEIQYKKDQEGNYILISMIIKKYEHTELIDVKNNNTIPKQPTNNITGGSSTIQNTTQNTAQNNQTSENINNQTNEIKNEETNINNDIEKTPVETQNLAPSIYYSTTTLRVVVADADGIASIEYTINDEETYKVPINEKTNNVSFTLKSKEGKNEYKITAIDILGNTKTITKTYEK